jgi:hypothetical protein
MEISAGLRPALSAILSSWVGKPEVRRVQEQTLAATKTAEVD